MRTVDLPAGPLAYEDSDGDGPVLLLLHGVMMDATVWDRVLPLLPSDVRCVRPVLPLGSHRIPLRRAEMATHHGAARMVGDLMEVLDLRDVTLVLNDWGGAQLLLAERPERVTRAALVACEAFENFPPGVPGRMIAASAAIPGAMLLTAHLQRFQWFQRAPGAWGWMLKHPVPRAVMDRWFEPARVYPAVRRDLRTFAASTPSRTELNALTERLRHVDIPVLVAWAIEDRLMPREHGAALAELLPQGYLVEIADSYTVVPLDQPALLAGALIGLLEREREETA
ncbi:alpha/beta fold hydrolase [Pseudactinotalea suaedae]|uniref:alpha/beta fold hydrolase n=1 Tax=Pseudactinotalea suaedae TaxID=1524924 RepID=UPI0012E21E85|nr:alpha/beta hydrolase [Pseudactinotalea suaedae]